jgi:hypothetical protein
LINAGNDPRNIAFLNHDAATLIDYALENYSRITPEIINFIAPFTEVDLL